MAWDRGCPASRLGEFGWIMMAVVWEFSGRMDSRYGVKAKDFGWFLGWFSGW